MSTRTLPRLGAVLAALAIVLAACGAGAPEVSDPKEILTKAVTAMQDAKSFHLAATVDGTLNADLMGTGASEMTLAGTTLDGDIDIANKKMKVSFALPSLMGLTGEIIQIDTTSYMKVSLMGPTYTKSEGEDVGGVDVSDPKAAIAELTTLLEKPEIAPTKGSDADCGGKKCYSVSIELTAAEMTSLSGPDSGADMDPSSKVTITILVEKDSLHLASITVDAGMGQDGSLKLTVAFSNWDKAVTIEAPPADQISQ